MPAMSNFRPIDRDMDYLLPPSVNEWLPERHLARFVVEVVDGLDLSAMSRSYRGSGSAPYHPSVLVGLLVYGYASGVFSSRQLERATYDSVAFRFVASNQHPDHDTVASFRRRFLPRIEALFVEVLQVAREMGLLKLGTIGLDGTKIHADASRHSALSWDYANRIEAQLKAEVAELMARAEATDQADVPDGMSIPDELAQREERLARIAEAKAVIEARAKERPRPRQGRLRRQGGRAGRQGGEDGPQSPVAGLRHRRSRGRCRATRSTSPTRKAGSCRFRAAVSSNATTRRRPWRPTACWWWRWTCRRPPTTSSS